MTSGTPTRAPRPEPTREQLLLAFRNLRRPHIWPPTLEEALAHPTLGVCLRNAARQLGRPTWTGKASTGTPPPAVPGAPAPGPPRAPPAVDFKRLAANDRDDQEDAPLPPAAAPTPEPTPALTRTPATSTPATAPAPMPVTRTPLPTLSQAQARRVFRRAVQSMIECIESESPSVTLEGQRWYDTRAMVDPYEHCPELIDLNREVLKLAAELGVTVPHADPRRSYLVRVVDQARVV